MRDCYSGFDGELITEARTCSHSKNCRGYFVGRLLATTIWPRRRYKSERGMIKIVVCPRIRGGEMSHLIIEMKTQPYTIEAYSILKLHYILFYYNIFIYIVVILHYKTIIHEERID